MRIGTSGAGFGGASRSTRTPACSGESGPAAWSSVCGAGGSARECPAAAPVAACGATPSGLLIAIAAAARTGSNRTPNRGYSAPIATGMSTML